MHKVPRFVRREACAKAQAVSRCAMAQTVSRCAKVQAVIRCAKAQAVSRCAMALAVSRRSLKAGPFSCAKRVHMEFAVHKVALGEFCLRMPPPPHLPRLYHVTLSDSN
jgi:hypothetical protein